MSDKQFKVEDLVNVQDTGSNSVEDYAIPIRGHLIFKDPITKEVVHEEDNLVLMRTRTWLFEQLFKTAAPANVSTINDSTRSIGLFSIGSGGADVNANPFTPYVPKFSDRALGQPVPFVIIDPDKDNNTESQSNPSIVKVLDSVQKKLYYMPTSNADGTTPYYAKRFNGATDAKLLGNSRGWDVNTNDGKVAFSISMTITNTEARGTMFNEIGLWLAKFDSATNTYKNAELATRVTFDTESLSSLTRGIEIEYVMYI